MGVGGGGAVRKHINFTSAELVQRVVTVLK